MSKFNINNLSKGNGSAYTKEENRTGPPLEYVGEKLRHSVESYHSLLLLINSTSNDDIFSTQKDYLRHISYGFHNSIVAFLALYNMLIVVENTEVIKEELSTLSQNEIKILLDYIENEGSVIHYE